MKLDIIADIIPSHSCLGAGTSTESRLNPIKKRKKSRKDFYDQIICSYRDGHLHGYDAQHSCVCLLHICGNAVNVYSTGKYILTEDKFLIGWT